MCENGRLQSISYVNMLVINRLLVNYDTPRHCLNFIWADF